jgi:hypothetical protein
MALSLCALAVLMVTPAAAASTLDVTPELRLVLCTPEIVRVFAVPASGRDTAAEAMAKKSPSLAVVNPWAAPVPHTTSNSSDGRVTTVTTSALRVVVDTTSSTALVSFFAAADGTPLLSETAREFDSPRTAASSSTAGVAMSWDSPASESLYGLGHFNFGVVDYRLAPIQLRQWNLWKISPLLVSTRGWGVLQETSYAEQDFNPVERSEAVALSNWTHSPTPQNSTATGSFVAQATGPHWLYLELTAAGRGGEGSSAYCEHGVRVRVSGVAAPVIDLFEDPCNLPPSTIGRTVELTAGTRYTLTIESWDTQADPPPP